MSIRKISQRSLFSRGKRNDRGRRLPTLQAVEDRRLMAVLSFQQGVSDYVSQEDTVLYNLEPEVNAGTEGSISPDQQDANGVRQGLLRFGNIFGGESNQIPFGAKINSATLILNVVNDSNSAMQMSFYRMQSDWGEATATWNTFGAIGGVQASEGESSDLPPDAVIFDPDTSAETPTAGRADVTRSLEYWASGVTNNGWMIESAATNGWDFRTKESAVAQRPQLIVDFEVPTTPQAFALSSTLIVSEGAQGQSRTAIVEVARTGSLDAPLSVGYSVTAGTAGASDFVPVPAGTLQFAANEAYQTVEITINGDDTLEGLESLQFTLTGGNVVPGRGNTTISIADDDALINEVLANISNAADETEREYIELIGTPGANLNGYYLVVFEGEEEGDDNSTLDGASAGIADLVFDLSGHSFGSNGLLLIAPSNWAYQSIADPATTIVTSTLLDGAGGILEDSSQTYALIRSPGAPLVAGVDYDTVGTYENETNQAIGVGVGILDQLPAGAELMDSVGVVEGGGGDRDRVATTELLGHPGIHVHQPTGFAGGNVTSDAVSRRFGQGLPNSIGAWFNGDIGDGAPVDGVISYENDTFFVSVVAPDGAVLTPGSHNVLRTVHFRVADQDKHVAEADGSVTVTIERTGDLARTIEVTYRTVDTGSARENVDFTAVNQTITFGPGESSKDITIALLADSVAEGFERFRIDITDVSPGYAITDGLSTRFGAIDGEAVVTVADANVSTRTFQNFVNGYSGTTDAYIDGEQIVDKFGQDPVVRVDQVKGEGGDVAAVVRPQQGLLRFNNLFGGAANQVPAGSNIFDAFLTVNVQNVAAGAHVGFYRMLQDWDQVNATWVDPQGSAGSSVQNGVTPDDAEASVVADAVVPDASRAGLVEIPLDVDTMQSWANGSLDNFGWSIISDSNLLWAFNSSEAFLPGTVAPQLTILVTSPTGGDAGAFSLAVEEVTVGESDVATVTINRIGGSSGPATVNWRIGTDGATTGSLDDVTGTSGTVQFADGEWFKTFQVGINNDVAVEPNETLGISLSGAGQTFGRQQATLMIRDNDFNPNAGNLLLNELWINSPGNDPPHEFVELKGQAGIGMGSLYYVAIEGLVGDREGTAEKVVDIGSFRNGSSGFTLITPDAEDFAFEVPTGATQIDQLGAIVTENVSSQNDSTTYLLLYSPLGRLALNSFDYDWDNDGALELPAGVQIVDSVGVRVLGSADQLYGPLSTHTAFGESDPEVDAISRLSNDTRRNEGKAWYGGDLFPAGDDYLLYETAESFGLPTTGAALSPGTVNTGNDTQSPLVRMLSVVSNANGSFTATFDGPVEQINQGDGSSASPGGSGITLTDPDGQQLPTVSTRPTAISGFGTSTLTFSFGNLPAGSYRLNFVGNGIIGNSRAVDVANTGAAIDSFFTFAFTHTGGGNSDDLNGDGVVDILDLDLICQQAGTGVVGQEQVTNFLGRQRIPVGDSSFDHQFNTGDLVTVFAAGKYETSAAAKWSEGDWNCDGVFSTTDLVAAFAAGNYEQGPLAAAEARDDSVVGAALASLFADDDKSSDPFVA